MKGHRRRRLSWWGQSWHPHKRQKWRTSRSHERSQKVVVGVVVVVVVVSPSALLYSPKKVGAHLLGPPPVLCPKGPDGGFNF